MEERGGTNETRPSLGANRCPRAAEDMNQQSSRMLDDLRMSGRRDSLQSSDQTLHMQTNTASL